VDTEGALGFQRRRDGLGMGPIRLPKTAQKSSKSLPARCYAPTNDAAASLRCSLYTGPYPVRAQEGPPRVGRPSEVTGSCSGGIVCGVEGWQLPGMPRVPGVSELVSQLQSQTEALAQLPLTVAALNSAVQGLIEAVTITRETAASAQRVSERLEEVIEELDEPVRALRPGLERAAKVLDDPVIDTVPETLRRLTEDVVPLVHGLRDAQTRVGLVFNQAANASARLAELPGAQLFRRRVRREDGEAGGGTG